MLWTLFVELLLMVVFLIFFFVIFFVFPKINSYPPEQYQICAVHSSNKDTINEQNRKHLT